MHKNNRLCLTVMYRLFQEWALLPEKTLLQQKRKLEKKVKVEQRIQTILKKPVYAIKYERQSVSPPRFTAAECRILVADTKLWAYFDDSPDTSAIFKVIK